MSGYDYAFAGPFPLPVCGQCENMDCQNKQCGQGNPCQSCITSFPRWCNCFCTRCSNKECVNDWCRDRAYDGKKCDHCKSLILKKGSCFCPTPPCFRCSNKDCINKVWCGRVEYGYQQCDGCVQNFACKCAKMAPPATFLQQSFGGAEGFVCTKGCKNPACAKKSCTGGCDFCQRNAPPGGWCKCAKMATEPENPILTPDDLEAPDEDEDEEVKVCKCDNPFCRNRKNGTCSSQNPCKFCINGKKHWCNCNDDNDGEDIIKYLTGVENQALMDKEDKENERDFYLNLDPNYENQPDFCLKDFIEFKKAFTVQVTS